MKSDVVIYASALRCRFKAISAALVVLAAVSCGKEGTPQPGDRQQQLMTFKATTTDDSWVAASAAVADNAVQSRALTPYPVGGKFGVMGFYTGTSNFATNSTTGSLPNLMYNQQVEWTPAGCVYTPPRYWVASDTTLKYTFIAYSPYNAPGVSFTPQEASFGGGTLTMAITNSPSAKVDLMLAVNANVRHKTNPVEFNFTHIMSRIRLAVIFQYPLDSVRIDKVVFNTIRNTGTITPLYRTDLATATSLWSVASATASVEVTPESGEEWVAHYTDDPAGAIVNGFSAYMLPQVYKANFDITITSYSSAFAAPLTSTFNCVASGNTTLAHKKAYLYKITLVSPTSVRLYATVEDWIRETGNEINADDTPFE